MTGTGGTTKFASSIPAISADRYVGESTIEQLRRDLQGKEAIINELTSALNAKPQVEDAQDGKKVETSVATKGKAPPWRLRTVIAPMRLRKLSPLRPGYIVMRQSAQFAPSLVTDLASSKCMPQEAFATRKLRATARGNRKVANFHRHSSV